MKRNRIKAQIVKILKDKRFENPHLRSTLIEAFGIEISVTSLRKDIVLADGSKSIVSRDARASPAALTNLS